MTSCIGYFHVSFVLQMQQIGNAETNFQDDVYTGPYESYKTASNACIPVLLILNSTFDKLHYGLTLNDHDNLFNL